MNVIVISSLKRRKIYVKCLDAKTFFFLLLKRYLPSLKSILDHKLNYVGGSLV